jgi:ketosteroid isomerase-like protein
MSENLDLVRSIHADWERGDWSSTAWAHPDIEFVIAGGLEPGSWAGIPAMRQAWFTFLGAWEHLRTEAAEYRDLGDGCVLVLHRWTGHGWTSALPVEQMSAKSATLFQFRDSKVSRLVAYWDRDRALADVGLEG